MTDRELLEMAAKAYGITQLDYRRGSDAYYYDDPETGREQWCPTGDDGQALRLLTRLAMVVYIDKLQKCTRVKWRADSEVVEFWHWNENQGADAATRTAITRAAAEIGKSMP